MARLRTRIDLDQREGSETVTITITTTEAHSGQQIRHRVSKATVSRDCLAPDELERHLAPNIVKALTEANWNVPF